jgi:hypothetical protein
VGSAKMAKVPILEKSAKNEKSPKCEIFHVGKSGRVWDGDKKFFLSFYH